MPGHLHSAAPLSGVLGALLLSVAACGGDEKPAAAVADATPRTVAVALESERRSGPSGTATLREQPGELTVTLHMNSRNVGYRAHIHDVTCGEFREIRGFDAQLATVSTSLEDVVKGTSVTVIRAPAPDLVTAGRSINIHKWEAPYPVVACGDIARR